MTAPTCTRCCTDKAARMREGLSSRWGPRARLPAVDAKQTDTTFRGGGWTRRWSSVQIGEDSSLLETTATVHAIWEQMMSNPESAGFALPNQQEGTPFFCTASCWCSNFGGDLGIHLSVAENACIQSWGLYT